MVFKRLSVKGYFFLFLAHPEGCFFLAHSTDLQYNGWEVNITGGLELTFDKTYHLTEVDD
jgi:hypothetical protein